MNPYSLELFSKLVSEKMGKISSDIISEIITLSNSEKYIFHGIKYEKDFIEINKSGIKRLTPESGFVSYWTSGKRFFGEIEKDKMQTYDSSFFHYAHSYQPDKNKSFMNLAITNHNDLENILTKDSFKIDACNIIENLIPREKIHILRVQLNCSNQPPSRTQYQMKERILLSQLYGILKIGYFPGDLTITTAEI